MGLSLLNIGKKVVDQINPLDNGKTYQNTAGNAPAQAAAGVAAPSLFQQATHNGLTNAVGSALIKPVSNTLALGTVDPARELIAQATNNTGAYNAQFNRTGADLQGSLPFGVANNVVRAGQAGYNLGFKAPILDLINKAQEADKARIAGLQEFNQTAPGQLVRPVSFGIANLGHATPQAEAATGLDPTATGAQKYFADPITGAINTYGLVKGGESLAAKAKGVPLVKPVYADNTPVPEAPIQPTPPVVANHIVDNLQNFDAPSQTAAAIAKLKSTEPAPPTPEIPAIQASRTMTLGRPGVRGSSNYTYNTDDANLNQIMRSSIIAAKGSAKTADEHAAALENVGLKKSDVKAIRDYSIRNADSKGNVDSAGLRQFISDRLSPPTPKVSFKAPDEVPTVSSRANSGIDPIDKAINDLSDHYRTPVAPNGNAISHIVEATKATQRRGSMLAARVGRAIAKNLTKEEDKAVYDSLQGVDNPDLTPRAAKVADALRGINKQALDIRQEVNPDVHGVGEYGTRIERSTISNALKNSGTGVGSKIQSIFDLGRLDSAFSKSRQVGKFVDENGNAVYGKPKDLGLTRHQDGTITNKDGVAYKQTTTNTHELQANTGREYLDKSGHVSAIYHADTASLQAKFAALKELNTNPTAHGLFTRSQVEAGGLEGMKEVSVNGLKDAEGNNFYAKAKEAKSLERDRVFGRPDTRSIPGKVYDAVSNIATQFIVINPLFHGANQLVQSFIAVGNATNHGGGWVRMIHHLTTATKDDALEYASQPGGFSPDYGSTMSNVLSRATHGATKINAKAMAAIELRFRVAAYKSSIEAGMKPADAVANINKFMGNDHQLSRATQRVTLFAHYFKTVGGALADQVIHPIKNSGATINTAMLAAINVGMTQQYQQFTGNQNAYVRSPGELGLGKDLIKSVGEIKKGEVPSMVTNKINSVAKEIGQQLTNHDLFTDKPVTDSVGGRVGHAINTLIAPTSQASQITSGKRSPAEIAENQLGAYSPHAKGYVASPKVSLLNTKGAIQSTVGGDPTGEKQQTQYFDALKKAQDTVHGDTKTEAQFNDYIARSKDPKTGQSISNSPAQSQQNGSALFSNDKLRNTVQTFEKAQANHDPVWDLSPDQLKQYMQYKAQFTGDAAKSYLLSQAQDGADNWITDLQAKEQDWYSTLQHTVGSKPAISTSPVYPTFDPDTTKLLATYNAADTSGKSVLQQQFSGQLSDAFNKIATYTNQMREAEGAPKLNSYPVADAETQAIIKAYNALPTGDGSKGGNATRYAWAQANPDAYAKMQDYLSKSSLSSLITQAAKAQFAGTEPSQQLLKDIKNLGTYDIASTKNSDGTSTYSLNPAAAYAESAATSSASYAASAKNKEAKYLGNASRDMVRSPGFHVRKAKVSFKKGSTSKGKFKVASGKPVKNAKVKLKV